MSVTVEPIERDGPIFNRAITENLGDYGEAEYVVEGVASDHGFVPDLTTTAILAEGLPYRTRMIVRRPPIGEANGTVMVEWLNPTAAWDGTPMWDLTRRHLVREGITWVGVTIKPVALEFLMGGARNPFQLAPVPEIASRYAQLDLFMGSRTDFTGEGLVWDMMNQITAYLRNLETTSHPLSGIEVDHVMQSGYSQSGGYLVTHANWFHQDSTDSYLIAGAGGAHRITFADVDYEHPDPRASLRERAGIPMVRLQTETEPVAFGRTVLLRPSVPLEWIRWWEIAGGAHAPVDPGGEKGIRDVAGFTGFGACDNPLNGVDPDAIQTEVVGHATVALLERWVRDGAVPPGDQFLELAHVPDEGFVELERDELGNARGGIRLPGIEVPTATYTGTNTGEAFCFLFGSRIDFDRATLDELYPTHDDYVEKIDRAIAEVVAGSFLLPDDVAYVRDAALDAFARLR